MFIVSILCLIKYLAWMITGINPVSWSPRSSFDSKHILKISSEIADFLAFEILLLTLPFCLQKDVNYVKGVAV